MADMVQFYKDFGVGKLGLHKAFRVGRDENDKVEIQHYQNCACEIGGSYRI